MGKNYFDEISTVFEDKDILQIDYVVGEDRIVGRDQQLEDLARSLNPAKTGGKPSNCLLYGKPGTGKSLCVKFISQQLREAAEANNQSLGVAYVDCAQSSTETDAIISAAQQLNILEKSQTQIPDTGLSTGQFYKRAWRVIEKSTDIAIIILDEIDKHQNFNELLMKLSRAGEAGKLSTSSLGVIGISNKPRFTDRLDERTLSSLSERRHVFPPYSSGQLEEILRARNDAYKEGVIEEGIIPRIAALSAREYGDARKAMDIFRYAGEIANERNSNHVKLEYIDEAFDRAETEEILEVISTLPYHSTLIIWAVASLSADRNTDQKPVTTKEAYRLYERKCNFEAVEPLSERRIRDLLQEAEFLEIITKETKAAGKSKGSRTKISLIDDPGKTLEACELIKSTE